MADVSFNPNLVISNETEDMRMVLQPSYTSASGREFGTEGSARILSVADFLMKDDRECTMSSIASYRNSRLIGEDFAAMLTSWEEGTEAVQIKDEQRREIFRQNVATRVSSEITGLKAALKERVEQRTMIRKPVDEDAASQISSAFLTLHKLSFLGYQRDELSSMEETVDGALAILDWTEGLQTKSASLNTQLAAHKKWVEHLGQAVYDMKTDTTGILTEDHNTLLDMLDSWEWHDLYTGLKALTHAIRSGQIDATLVLHLRQLDEVGIQRAMSDWDGYCKSVLGIDTQKIGEAESAVDEVDKVAVSQAAPTSSKSSKRRKKQKARARERANAISKANQRSRGSWKETRSDWATPQRVFVDVSPAARQSVLDAFAQSTNSFASLR